MLIERLPAKKESKDRLDDLLARYACAQEQRVGVISVYAEGGRCKHDCIADYFGEPPIEGCVTCDKCAGHQQPSSGLSKQARPQRSDLTDAEKRRKIIETVSAIPGKARLHRPGSGAQRLDQQPLQARQLPKFRNLRQRAQNRD